MRLANSAMSATSVRVRRIYEDVQADDGTRVLVDRLWPRGMSKAAAHLDEWCKQIAPSPELREWYQHDPALLPEFTQRYQLELQTPERAAALEHLRTLAKTGTLTLLTATRVPEISHARVLADLLHA